MKILQPFTLCVFMIFATFIFAESKETTHFEMVQTQNYFPNIFSPITSFVKKIFGKKRKTVICYIGILEISNLENSETTNCLNNKPLKIIASFSPESDEKKSATYEVSGGKLIKTENEVFWDLNGVPQGNYTITVSDSSCGLCGKLTKTVKVIDCSN